MRFHPWKKEKGEEESYRSKIKQWPPLCPAQAYQILELLLWAKVTSIYGHSLRKKVALAQGRGSLVGCRLWGCTESDTTEAT